MPLYDYGCPCGYRFEAMVASDASGPDCPRCGAATSRRPGLAGLTGRARVPAGPDQAPKSWQGTHRGNREYVAQWRRTLDKRERLEEKYPELKRDDSPVVAHEGRFHAAPLTARELASGAPIVPRPAAPHPHPHPH